MRPLEKVVICIMLMLIGFAFIGIGKHSHGFPLCPRCSSEYERGRGDAIVELQASLEEKGYAVFVDGRWMPAREVTVERLMKEGK